MGSIIDGIFGSKSKQDSSSTSNSSSQSGNQAYGSLSQALSPTLNFSSQAGSMIASLLGLPGLPHGGAPMYQDNYTYDPTTGQAGAGDGGSTAPRRAGSSLGTGANSPAQSGSDNLLGENFSYGNLPDTGGGAFNLKPTFADLRANGALDDAPSNTVGSPGTETGQPLPAPSPVSSQDSGSALDNFANSSGMDFMRDQGVKAIEASQAGKGMLQSGATGQALSTFGNNLGKTYLNDYLNHLMDYAGIGTKNAAVLGSAGNTSSSTGFGSSSGSGVGGKNGLINNIIAAI